MKTLLKNNGKLKEHEFVKKSKSSSKQRQKAGVHTATANFKIHKPEFFQHKYFLSIALLLSISMTAAAQSHVTISGSNCTQTGNTTMTIDLYIVNDGTDDTLWLGYFNAGLNVNAPIENGGSLSWNLVSGTSDVSDLMSGALYFWKSTTNELQIEDLAYTHLSADVPPLPNGTSVHLGTFLITNTASWAAGDTTQFNWQTTSGENHEATFAYAFTRTDNTVSDWIALTSSPNLTLSLSCSIILCTSPTPPTAGNNGPVCAGSTLSLTASTITGATYSWTGPNGFTSTSQNPTVSSSATSAMAGTYSVTATTGTCTGSAGTTTVTVNSDPTPTITAATATTFCAGGSVTLDAGSYTSYSWSTSATTETITASSAGTYTVTVTNSNACTGTATKTITVNSNPTPSVTAATATTFCAGGSVSLDAGSYTAYSWNTSATTETITASANGTYTVTVTDGNGCTGTATKTITVNSNPTPTITAGGAITFCAGGSVTLDAGSYSSYSWTTGATTETITATSTRTDSVTVTDGNGCTGIATKMITVNVNPTPTITAGGATTFCAGGSVTLDAGSYSGYSWTTGATTETITATSTRTDSVTVTDGNGCTGIATKSVTVNANPTPTITAGGATTFCAGGSVTLDAGSYASYNWTTGATTETITATTTRTDSVTVTDGNGCTGIATKAVTVNGLPTISFTTSNFNSFGVSQYGASNGWATANASGAGGYSYSWSTAATTQKDSALTAGTYSVTVTDANSCTNTNSITLTQPTALHTDTLNSPLYNGYNVSCYGGANGAAHIVISGGVPYSGAGEGVYYYLYSWTNGIGGSWTTQNIASAPAGHYTIVITDANGATLDTGITLTQPNPLQAALTPSHYSNGYNVSIMGAHDGSITATPSGGIGSYTYSWTDVANDSAMGTLNSIDSLYAGLYSVTVTDTNSCTLTAERWIVQPSTWNGAWGMAGNAHSDPSYDFMGTTDSTDMVFRTNNTQAMRISATYGTSYFASSMKINGMLQIDTASADTIRAVYLDAQGNLQVAGEASNSFNVVPQHLQGGGTQCVFITKNWVTDYCNHKNDIFNNPLSGNVGIGCEPNYSGTTSYKLDVAGIIHGCELKVDLLNGCDFVFDDKYKLTGLPELEKYLKEHKHLPDIAPAKEMEANGVNVGEMQAKLLQKIEELTLYVIEQNKRIEELENKIKK